MSHSWHLGICIPKEILGPEGYFARYQRNIESLSLVTNDECDENLDGPGLIDLSCFTGLSHLSWLRVHSHSDLKALRSCLHINAKHLSSLKLSLDDWDVFFGTHVDHFAFQNPFADEILFSEHRHSRLSLPSLKHLSLTEVSFAYAEEAFREAFNFQRLHQLRLFNCSETTDLLRNITSTGQKICLTSFGIWMDDTIEHHAISDPKDLCNFLLSFTGLQELTLDFASHTVDWTEILQASQSHASTLQRVTFAGSLDQVTIMTPQTRSGVDETMTVTQLSEFLGSLKCDFVGLEIDINVVVSASLESNFYEAGRLISALPAIPTCPSFDEICL